VHKGLDELLSKLDVLVNRIVLALIVLGGLVGSGLVGLRSAGPQLLGLNIVSFVGFIASGILGAWLLWGVIRSGRI
jgi:ubiquinone biosynthesis protein